MDISENSLDALPPALFANCPSLEVLEAGKNRIASLPTEVSRCSALVKLVLAGNLLTALPASPKPAFMK